LSAVERVEASLSRLLGKCTLSEMAQCKSRDHRAELKGKVWYLALVCACVYVLDTVKAFRIQQLARVADVFLVPLFRAVARLTQIRCTRHSRRRRLVWECRSLSLSLGQCVRTHTRLPFGRRQKCVSPQNRHEWWKNHGCGCVDKDKMSTVFKRLRPISNDISTFKDEDIDQE
jgi:hypothetical protein